MRVTRLPYREDSVGLFDGIASEPWAVFLDSGRPAAGGRWDILAGRPYATLTTCDGLTRIEDRAGILTSRADPLGLLRGRLAPVPARGDFPFMGGAIGYFAYDLARTLGELSASAKAPCGLPDMVVGLYDWAVLVDHDACTTHLVGAGRDAATGRDWHHLVELFSRPGAAVPGSWTSLDAPLSSLPWPSYREAFARAQGYIAEGDCYQINLTQLYAASVRGSRWGLYQALRRLNPAPYGAYLNHPGAQVLSTSPERFIELRGDRVATRPIKGTRPRGASPASDRALAAELAASAKDRAENLMIVDLLRNDLGKVCRTGSVAVPGLFEVESFANVHHLVSTVSGTLGDGHDAIDLLRATFPGGSITGAPKRRAMAIIDELEPHRRGLYCGAIGYLGYNGDMDTNIAIRTLVSQGDAVRFGVGGGIVADSVAEQEYQECLDKAAPMLSLLQPGGRE
ncbi:MAG: aminodeoxychorismate synthase component I [Gallionellaceae bacterium]|nr:aminodeoxychorismate synthase component I [Gallionellaceae bacterium]